jgi:hypothetical protein
MVSAGMERALAMNLLAQELSVERWALFPIRAVIEMVQQGDLIVSDMYLPEDFIFDLVRDLCDLHEMRPIIRSNWGKHTGTIWPEIKSHYAIRTHFGDNPRSDIETPRKFGIEANLVGNSRPTPWERMVSDLGLPHLALVLREARLRGMTNEAGAIQHVIAGPYLTLLYGFSVWLAGNFGDERRFIFLRRDADDLARVFAAVNPTFDSASVDLSRDIIGSQSFDLALVPQVSSNAILVDPVTSGQTVFRFLERIGDTSIRLAALIHLNNVVVKDQESRIGALINAGRLAFVVRQSDMPAHHHNLECLLQTPWPPLTSIGYDRHSGGVVRSYGFHDLTPGEGRLISAKLRLVREFTASLRWRGSSNCDASTALVLIKAALAAIFSEKDLIAAFPSFVIRERGSC